MGEECGKLNSVQGVFKGGSKKLWRAEALNEFVADPHRHRERERCEGLGCGEFLKNRGLVNKS